MSAPLVWDMEEQHKGDASVFIYRTAAVTHTHFWSYFFDLHKSIISCLVELLGRVIFEAQEG